VVSKRFHLAVLALIIITLITPLNSYCQNYTGSGDGWEVAERFVAANSVKVYSKISSSADVIDILRFDEKVLVINIADEISNELFVKILHPAVGFIERSKLKTKPYQQEDDQFLEYSGSNKWTAQILYGNHDYNFIKEEADYASRNIATIKAGDPLLIIKRTDFEQQSWLQVVYPTNGFINWENVEGSFNLFFFEFGITSAPLNIPYEKEFKHKTSPIGGYIKFANDAWNMGVRLYYTVETTQTKLFELETHRGGLEINYDFLKLFDDKLTFYGFIGGGYWASTFQNTKYPNMAYYKTENASGPMYNAGGGFNVMYYNFVFDVHYAWFGTEEGVFGADPIPGEFMNQYKFFISAHQLITSIGYRIEL
jgi:hypothetical protein